MSVCGPFLFLVGFLLSSSGFPLGFLRVSGGLPARLPVGF